MMRRLLVLFGLCTALCTAQLQLLQVPGVGIEEPVGAMLDLGCVTDGDLAEVRLRLRNVGGGSVSLDRLRASGAGFTLRGNPTLPFVVAPGSNVDFRVRFEPSGHGSYSGSLRINDSYVLLLASASAGLSVSVEEDGAWLELTSGDTVVLGRVQQGESVTRSLQLTNPSDDAIDLSVLAVDGDGFVLAGEPAVPAVVQPGAVVQFAIRFEPRGTGIIQALLTVNDRLFILEGVATAPPYPDLEIHFESNALVSGVQSKVKVRLLEAAPADGTGRLRMVFAPDRVGVPDDPAVLFMNGERAVRLTVEQGKTDARLDDLDEVWFQTGTTAGEIRFTAELGDRVREAAVTLPRAAVSIDSGSWSKTETGIAVRVAGFDNTRSVAAVSFHFFDVEGRALTTNPMTTDVANSFRGFYSNSGFGGLFLLEAAFPVAGDRSLIGAVDIQFTSDLGASRIHRVNFR